MSVAEGNIINPALTLICPQDKYQGQILSTALVISAKKGLWKGERCPKSSRLRCLRTIAQAFCITHPELPICLCWTDQSAGPSSMLLMLRRLLSWAWCLNLLVPSPLLMLIEALYLPTLRLGFPVKVKVCVCGVGGRKKAKQARTQSQ